MTSHDLYTLVGLPSPIREQFSAWDETRTPLLEGSLRKRLLCRATWPEAEKELETLIGEDPDHLIILWEMLRESLNTWENYQKCGISLDIFRDTMAFSTRYLNDALKQIGRYHFNAPWWFPRELSMEEFRLGALEYEFLSNETEKTVSIHIPSDADLSPESLDASFESFAVFQRTFFPLWNDTEWFCDSWLMSPALPELLPVSSRILGFQRRFELVRWDQTSTGVLTWVFPGYHEVSEALPETTSLQRSMKQYLLSGKTVGWALARLRRN